MTSLRMGSSPEWWTPMPRFSMGRMCVICGGTDGLNVCQKAAYALNPVIAVLIVYYIVSS